MNAAQLRRHRAAMWPMPRAVLDLDFVRQRYWWNGQLRTTAAFTTYTLNASTFNEYGLTPSTTIDWTLALAGVGTVVPGAYAVLAGHNQTVAAANNIFQLDDATANERVACNQSTTPSFQIAVVDGGATQCTLGPAVAGTLNVFHGHAASYDTNSFIAASNGVLGTTDTAGTLPTVTTLRIGKGTAASTEILGFISRLILFNSVRTSGEVIALSVATRMF